MVRKIEFVDSHTAGEPTRVILSGGPELGAGPLSDRVEQFRAHHDSLRRAMVTEPRGADVLIGALLCEPADDSCDAGVIFFNNVGYLGMCGHGLIGFVETLKQLGRLNSDGCRIETPVGIVEAKLEKDGAITFDNVLSFRKASEVEIDVPSLGLVVGDVAWGGNWFFLTKDPKPLLSVAAIPDLLELAKSIRQAVNNQGYPEVDHVELFGDPVAAGSDSRNFVLCPGLEYDRSPCGTGTSAKLACLAADGVLGPGETWIQEGILGTSFSSVFRWSSKEKQEIIPTVTGCAFLTAEGRLLLHDADPFRMGISTDETVL